MHKNLFIEGLLKQDLDTTTFQYAMWNDLGVWTTAIEKSKGKFSNEDKLSKKIEESKNDYFARYVQNPEKLRALLILDFCKHLKIEDSRIEDPEGLYHLGSQIESETINLQKKITKNEKEPFRGSTIDDLVKYNLKKMFTELATSYKHESESKQENITETIESILEDMPEEQKKKMREQLNVDHISKKVLHQALLNGSLGVAFASAVDVAGFSAYIFAAKALSAVAGILGVTLPFSIYIALSSVIAFISNPIFIAPTILGGSFLMTKWANNKIKNNILPAFVTQLCLASSKIEDTSEKARLLASCIRSYN